MHRDCLWAPDDFQCYGLVGIATQAAHFEVGITAIDRIADSRRWLRRSLVSKHAVIPSLACESVGYPASLLGTLGRHLDLGAVEIFTGFGRHDPIKSALTSAAQIIKPLGG